jgi:hypothetical protein
MSYIRVYHDQLTLTFQKKKPRLDTPGAAPTFSASDFISMNELFFQRFLLAFEMRFVALTNLELREDERTLGGAHRAHMHSMMIHYLFFDHLYHPKLSPSLRPDVRRCK